MISILFAARDSVYKTIEGLDVWDEDRNALLWPGGNPGIFHPPCRLWSSQMRHFSRAPEIEKACALWSVDKVRINGGVLEHPACSLLWDQAELPKPGTRDKHGFSVALYQYWFGHKAQKATWLYVCGVQSLPEVPFKLRSNEWFVRPRGGKTGSLFENMNKKGRNATPVEFARWLVETAKLAS